MSPSKMTDQQYLKKQYQDSSNLDARVRLHQRFSANPHGWHPWVFDHFELPPACRILELGSGPGYLWRANLARIPAGWEIVLSDFSAGMLDETQRQLGERAPFRFEVIDAQSISFEDGHFDAVIANHMLYHVPDKPKALAEIRRVLKPGGHFYASTIGERHLSEIADLIKKYNGQSTSWQNVAASFTLENGAAQLSPCFADIELDRYIDSLEVTEATPLVDYILSGRNDIPAKKRERFKEFVQQELESRGGVIHIHKDSGLFTAMRKGT
jgi:SAM-dependent methyltransferase